jgi:hypothetical protein
MREYRQRAEKLIQEVLFISQYKQESCISKVLQFWSIQMKKPTEISTAASSIFQYMLQTSPCDREISHARHTENPKN